MSLYDDLDNTDKKSDSNVSGWASGIKLFHSHMQLKKATVTQPKRDLTRKQPTTTLTPVVNLKSKAKTENNSENSSGGTEFTSMKAAATLLGSTSFNLPFSVIAPKEKGKKKSKQFSAYLSVDPEWQFENEYDPLWPNDYEKALRELRERRDKEAEEEESKRRLQEENRDEEELPVIIPVPASSGRTRIEIAPPPSLAGPSLIDTKDPLAKISMTGKFATLGASPGGGTSAAARIMAKYGYKEGQGLGKKEQGMSTALQVEKTSFRTGRIIHESDSKKELSVFQQQQPNPMGLASTMAAYNDADDEDVNPDENNDGPTLVDLLKNPSKVILLKNMVGPGEVDDDLEPEVKEECQSKFGEVSNVTVFQMPDMEGEDPIRIFVEFKKVESAAKALLDLNGRFFGGRQVKASFYDFEKYTNLELTL